MLKNYFFEFIVNLSQEVKLKKIILYICLFLILFMSTTNALSAQIEAVLSDDAGADEFVVKDSGSAAVASINSNGDLTLKAQADVRFADSDSSNYVSFQSPATVSTNVTWTLPAADGLENQVLSTNGSGTLSWAAGAGASTTLNNLGTVAVNTSIISDANDTDDLGSLANAWANTYSNKVFTTVIAPHADGTTALQINKADGTTNVLNVDTTNSRLGIGTTSPGAKLDITSSGYDSVVFFSRPAVAAKGAVGGFGASDGAYAYFTSNLYINSGGSLSFTNDAQPGWMLLSDARSGEDKFQIGRAPANEGGGPTVANFLTVDNAGKVGIGTAAPGYLLHVNAAASSDSNFSLSDGDVAHGITDVAQTAVYGKFAAISSTAGGLDIKALSDTDAQALSITGVIGSTNPTDATPAVRIVGSKKNTTSPQDLAAAETVFAIANNDNADALTVLGDGSVKVISTGTYELVPSDGTLNIDGGITADDVITFTGLGTGTGTDLVLNGSNQVVQKSSSLRYKKDVVPLEFDAAKVLELKPVSFTWKSSGERDFGFIAEEVNKILPQLVNKNKDAQPESVKYDQVAVLLLAEVKKQNDAINILIEKVEQLSNENKILKSEIGNIQRR